MHADARGSSAIEFAIVAPVLILFLCGIIETGVIFWGQSTLFYATADTARMVRTGQLSGTVTAATIKTQICNRIAGMISTATCNSSLQIDMRSYTSFSSSSFPSMTNANGTLNTGSMAQTTNVAACNIVLIRAFYPWPIMTPIMKPLLRTATDNTHLLYAAAAFRNEPYAIGPC
jgi:Flp pilus assembly protein TadG